MDTSGGSVPPPAGRERLAAELRRQRDLAGVSGRELAQRIGISQSKVSRIESGVVVPSLPEVTAWGEELGVPVETQERLTALTEAAYDEVHPWRAALQRRGNLQDTVQDLESTATRIRTFQPALVPGLLQTAEYARRVIGMFHRQYSEADPAAEVAGRLHRQLALYETKRHFDFLVTETALRWRPGPVALQAAQLDRIASVGTLDNVTIGFIPLDVEATALTTHNFVIYEGDDGAADATVSVETIHADMTVDTEEHVALYRSRWEQLSATALFGDEAQEFLRGVVADLRTRSTS
ncbi:helix-turn-helix domain-containing protein [Actinophytocola glycyrrhizae]|uniref:Helix-turn-helix domain-containing protein n=1 Tax=Actinophytocola glycyrrhizae TaxID=2044873 RepID=A0ABV9SB04_9PSEU